jgi:hypothetical protein
MNRTLKDRAWRLFEVAVPATLVLLVVIHWKSFLVWLFDSGMVVAEAVIPLLLLAVLLFATEKSH